VVGKQEVIGYFLFARHPDMEDGKSGVPPFVA
jgi:hypothetical protein